MEPRRPWTAPFAILCLCLCTLRTAYARREVEHDAVYQATFEQLLQAGDLQLDLQSNDNHFDGRDWDQNPEEYAAVEDPDSRLPWSYAPACTQQIPALDTKLCVYTNTSFNNGRGISIFTTPELAPNFFQILTSFKTPNPALEFGENKLDINGTENWRTAQVPDRGIGMLANRPLARGDLIFSSTPVLVAVKESLLPKHTREKFLQLAISQLPAASGEAYRALATMYHDREIFAQDVASANSFLVHVGEMPHLAVIPEPSRMNHDCGPNAVYLMDATTLAHVVRVTRPIVKDEEITISYTTPIDSFSKRQAYLLKSFGFNCTCRRCQNNEASDAALAEMASLTQSLAQWSDPSSSASIKQAERLIQLNEEESLHGYMDPGYCLAALMYSSVGSERGAQKYIDLCIKAIELRLGPGMEDLPDWKQARADIKAHWSWMRRKRS